LSGNVWRSITPLSVSNLQRELLLPYAVEES
jgi:hypothetical protein